MRNSNRGVVLISILFVTLVATFFIGALLKMTPNRLRVTVHDEKRDLALAAARAGVEYALSQLASDPAWRGQGTGKMIDSPNLVVQEDNGNIFGWVRTTDSQWAAFRLRFNYQDGDGGLDGLPQPKELILTPAISVNNLAGKALNVPLGTGPDNSFQGDVGFSIPSHSITLLVEGVAGDGLQPGEPISATGLSARRTIEGIYQLGGISPEAGIDGAVLMSGADANFYLGKPPATSEPDKGDDEYRGILRLMAEGQTARIRAKGNALLQSSSSGAAYNFYPDMDAEVSDLDGVFNASTKSGQTFSPKTEGIDDPFLEVAWDEVATSKQTDPIKLPAGVYVFRDAASGGNSIADRINYYPMSFTDYRDSVQKGNPPVSATLPASFTSLVNLDSILQPKITLTKDADVEAIGHLNSLTIIPASGAPQLNSSEDPLVVPRANDSLKPQDIDLHFAPSEASGATIRAKGTVTIGAQLSGDGGAIVSDSTINLVGLNKKPDAPRQELSLYAKKDINISTYDSGTGNFGDLGLSGVLLSKENMMIRLGDEVATSTWGSLDFKGTLIATGKATTITVPASQDTQSGNTENQTPGNGMNQLPDEGDSDGDESGTTQYIPGYANFIARGIRLCYEPRFAAPILPDNTAKDMVFRTISQTER